VVFSSRKVAVMGVITALTALLAVPMASEAKPTAASKMQLGELLFFNGNIDGAINAFRYALTLNPKLWEAHLNLVNMYIQKSDFPNAIEECKEVLKVKPTHKDVHLIMGNLLRAQGDLDGAVASLNKALECGANVPMGENALGLTHLQRAGDEKKSEAEKKEAMAMAQEHIGNALKKQPKFPDAHLTMGVVQFKKGAKEEALKEMDIAIKQKGKYPEARNAKGDMLASDNKWKEALVEYQKAVEEEPKYAQAWASIGNAQLQLGDVAAAKEAYAKAKAINPSDKNVIYGLALMLEKSGRIDDALAEFQSGLMLENDPQMAANIKLHMDQLRGHGSFNIGGIGLYGGNALIKDAATQNPFGASFADMIKIKSPGGKEKDKEKSK
jgi:tetratricopeptide (TPR) repeat protein